MTNLHAASQLNPRLMQLALKAMKLAERRGLSARLLVKDKGSFTIKAVVNGKPQDSEKLIDIIKECAAEKQKWYKQDGEWAIEAEAQTRAEKKANTTAEKNDKKDAEKK